MLGSLVLDYQNAGLSSDPHDPGAVRATDLHSSFQVHEVG